MNRDTHAGRELAREAPPSDTGFAFGGWNQLSGLRLVV